MYASDIKKKDQRYGKRKSNHLRKQNYEVLNRGTFHVHICTGVYSTQYTYDSRSCKKATKFSIRFLVKNKSHGTLLPGTMKLATESEYFDDQFVFL